MTQPKPTTTPQLEEPKFGFNEYAERLNGRAAMIGFMLTVLIEYSTGQGLLNWLGLRQNKDLALAHRQLTLTFIRLVNKKETGEECKKFTVWVNEENQSSWILPVTTVVSCDETREQRGLGHELLIVNLDTDEITWDQIKY